MADPHPGPRRPSAVVGVLLRGAVGFAIGGVGGLLFGWVVSPPTPSYVQLYVMMRGFGIGAMLGTSAVVIMEFRTKRCGKDE